MKKKTAIQWFAQKVHEQIQIKDNVNMLNEKMLNNLYMIAKKKEKEQIMDVFEQGYDEGFDEGHTIGFSDGYDLGIKEQNNE
jgi:flagellar biosynthesis/type III secretory pathway protein FliH